MKTPIPGGFLAVVEGIDGTGKSTVAALLAQWCGERGLACVFSKEPTGVSHGRKLRESANTGRLSLDEVNERFGLELESEQVETIGGLICEIAGSIPPQGEAFALGPWRFLVHEADPKHIETLRVERAE